MGSNVSLPKITFDTKFYISKKTADTKKLEKIATVLKFLNLKIVENKELADVVVILEPFFLKETLPVIDLRCVVLAIGFLQRNSLTYSSIIKYLNNCDVGMNLVGLTLLKNCDLGQLIYDILNTSYPVTFFKLNFLDSPQFYILDTYLAFLNSFVIFKLFRSNKEILLWELSKYKIQINDTLFKNIIAKIEHDDTKSS